MYIKSANRLENLISIKQTVCAMTIRPRNVYDCVNYMYARTRTHTHTLT